MAKTCGKDKSEPAKQPTGDGNVFRGPAAPSSSKDDFPLSDPPLGRKEYANVKSRRELHGSTSAELAKITGYDETQIRRAIRTKTYEEYTSND